MLIRTKQIKSGSDGQILMSQGGKAIWEAPLSDLRGVGRPDIANTTNGVIKGNEADGTFYYSTNGGGGVGAYRWVKQNGTWKVVDGDTGWRKVHTNQLTAGFIMYRRTATHCYVTLGGGPWGTVTLKTAPANSDVEMRFVDYNNLPNGWRIQSGFSAPITWDGFRTVAIFYISGKSDANFLSLRGWVSGTRTDRLRFPLMQYSPEDSWPATLPGDPV